MNPILGRTFSGFIFTFTVVMGISILLSFGLTARLNRQKPIPNWADTAVFVLVFAWLGARVGFIWANWDFFQAEPNQLYKLWNGGHSYYGALVTGLLALLLWCVLKKRPFAQVAALFAPAFILVQAGGWLACYYEGCAYGAESFLGPFSANLPDTFGVFAVRYQTQLIGFFLSLLLFVLIYKLKYELNDWQLLGFTMIGLSMIHLLTKQYRGDVVFYALTQAIDLGLLLLGSVFVGYGRFVTQAQEIDN